MPLLAAFAVSFVALAALALIVIWFWRNSAVEIVGRGIFAKKERLVDDASVVPMFLPDGNGAGGIVFLPVPVRTLILFSDGQSLEVFGDVEIPYPPGAEIVVFMNSMGQAWVGPAR